MEPSDRAAIDGSGAEGLDNVNNQDRQGQLKLFLRLGAVCLLVGVASAQTSKPVKSDDQIRKEIIKESISHYSGSCPCPYNKDRAGHSCGKRSAYSRPGGASPLCYPSDVTQKMVDDYRKRKD